MGEESIGGRGGRTTTTQPCGKGQRVFVLIANSVQTVKRSSALHQWNVRSTVSGINGSMHAGRRASLTRLRKAPAGFCGSRPTCLPGQKKKRRVRLRRKNMTATSGPPGGARLPGFCPLLSAWEFQQSREVKQKRPKQPNWQLRQLTLPWKQRVKYRGNVFN